MFAFAASGRAGTYACRPFDNTDIVQLYESVWPSNADFASLGWLVDPSKGPLSASAANDPLKVERTVSVAQSVTRNTRQLK